jgi:hypothetical protein
MKNEERRSENDLRPAHWFYFFIHHSKDARVTAADAKQTTVAAFRPWRGS